MTAPSPGPDDPEGRLGPTRVRDLILLAVGAAILGWVLIAFNFGDFPIIRWYTGAALFVLAAVEAVVALVVRRRVADNEVGQAREQLHPLTVARLVALAKASAIVGAVAAGAWGAIAGYLFHLQDVASANASKAGSIIGALGGIALVVAALWLEQCCRAPDDPTDDGQVPNPDAA
ncbi:DUF3180 domain-containing protein [Gordonia sp. X0973]|uniref:DUF3180 domain-containing protein n=1 Tax=Gordonia sp. X0973 TaxID=2742602 RepID=UPI000F54BFAB|nr:DUF3180 domain-containing protein [Gordonia sp. X0973]QKT08545.1 DUF3180 domain-containing protein [Gordonia sp. X0973]